MRLGRPGQMRYLISKSGDSSRGASAPVLVIWAHDAFEPLEKSTTFLGMCIAIYWESKDAASKESEQADGESTAKVHEQETGHATA
jgi:hypothetical protein